MKIPVLIIGAGPTGLMMAAQLARFGVDFRIIEHNAHPSEKTKAIAVQARTLEIYEQMNLINDVLAEGLKFKTTHIIGKGVVKANIQIGDFGKNQSPYPFIQIFTQDKNESLLISYLEKYNKSVEWSKEYQDLIEVEDGVEVNVKSVDGTIETITADYVVGCDGGKSPVRHSLKIPFEGETYEQVFFVADTAVDWKYGYGDLMLCLGKNKFAAFFPMPGEKRFRVVSIVPEKFLGKAETTFDDIKKIISDELNIKAEFYDTSWFAEYHIHHRVVSTFSKGNVFLAGDAAHIHSPAGGQGMNTGLQDAYNLAWKLASVLKHNADRQLLNTYNEERLPNAIRLVNTTDRAFTFIINANPFLRANVIPVIANIAIRIPFIRKFMFKAISQIGITYDNFSLARGANRKIKAGQRLPYTELFLDKDDVNIYTLLKAPMFHILICLKEKTDDDEIKLLTASLEKIIPNFIKVIVIDPLQTYPLECWGIKTNSIIVVRPDNYIGCIVNELNPIAIGFEKVERWFEEKIFGK